MGPQLTHARRGGQATVKRAGTPTFTNLYGMINLSFPSQVWGSQIPRHTPTPPPKNEKHFTRFYKNDFKLKNNGQLGDFKDRTQDSFWHTSKKK